MPSPHLKFGKLRSIIIIFFFWRIKYLHKLFGVLLKEIVVSSLLLIHSFIYISMNSMILILYFG